MTTRSEDCGRRNGSQDARLPARYRLTFASSYVYSPRGRTGVSERSRALCAQVKSGRSCWMRRYAACVLQHSRALAGFRDLFHREAVLIPVPASGRTCHKPWIAQRLAVAIRAMGLGSSVWTGVHRQRDVGKSATAWIWERPTVQEHFQSFAVDSCASPLAEIVLIDDVITKGRTLLAAAMRLQQVFPDARIRAFALVRTMGLVSDIQQLFEPCLGEIRWNGEDAHRDP